MSKREFEEFEGRFQNKIKEVEKNCQNEIRRVKDKYEKDNSDLNEKIATLAENSMTHGEVLLGIEQDVGEVTKFAVDNEVKLEEYKEEAIRVKEEVDRVKEEMISTKQDIIKANDEIKEVIRTLPERINVLMESRERRMLAIQSTQAKNAPLLTRDNILASIANQMAIQRPYTSQSSSLLQRNLFSRFNSEDHNDQANGSFGN